MLENFVKSHYLKLTESQARYERKFYISELSKHAVLALLKHNPAVFREIYYRRYVNNLYLDTPELKNYNENVVGAQHRQKVRIRWYGDLIGDISQATLEIKIKNGLVGKKQSYRLPPLHIGSGFCFKEWLSILRESSVPDSLCSWLASYEPTLINRYTRQYFLSADKLFRATIDSEMRFCAMEKDANMLLHWAESNRDTVLELKYEPNYDLQASKITSVFPFRVSKSSKYVTGIESTLTSCGHCRELNKVI